MKIQEGPAFGALIIGIGLGYLVLRQTQNVLWAVGAGITVAFLDYIFLAWINNFKNKK